MKSYLDQRLIVKSYARQKRFSDFEVECLLALGDKNYFSKLDKINGNGNGKIYINGEVSGICISDLAGLLNEANSSNLSQSLSRLEKRFLVYRLNDLNSERIRKEDRRRKEVVLTKQGSELYFQIKLLLD